MEIEQMYPILPKNKPMEADRLPAARVNRPSSAALSIEYKMKSREFA
jgi:hypothetical protein